MIIKSHIKQEFVSEYSKEISKRFSEIKKVLIHNEEEASVFTTYCKIMQIKLSKIL